MPIQSPSKKLAEEAAALRYWASKWVEWEPWRWPWTTVSAGQCLWLHHVGFPDALLILTLALAYWFPWYHPNTRVCSQLQLTFLCSVPAVSTQRSLMRGPPQMWVWSNCRLACQGQRPKAAGWPLTMRPEYTGRPHTRQRGEGTVHTASSAQPLVSILSLSPNSHLILF